MEGREKDAIRRRVLLEWIVVILWSRLVALIKATSLR